MISIIIYAINMAVIISLLVRLAVRHRVISVTLLFVNVLQSGALACSLWGPQWGWWALNAVWILVLLVWRRRADPGTYGGDDDGGDWGPDGPEDHGTLAPAPPRSRRGYRLAAAWNVAGLS